MVFVDELTIWSLPAWWRSPWSCKRACLDSL